MVKKILTDLLHWEDIHFERHSWYKTIFKMNLMLFSSDPFLPKIMNLHLLKHWVKIWGPSFSQFCKRFWLANCIGKFFILNSTSEISINLPHIWYLFFEQSTFAKIINIFLFEYWLKNWDPSRVSTLQKILIG